MPSTKPTPERGERPSCLSRLFRENAGVLAAATTRTHPRPDRSGPGIRVHQSPRCQSGDSAWQRITSSMPNRVEARTDSQASQRSFPVSPNGPESHRLRSGLVLGVTSSRRRRRCWVHQSPRCQSGDSAWQRIPSSMPNRVEARTDNQAIQLSSNHFRSRPMARSPIACAPGLYWEARSPIACAPGLWPNIRSQGPRNGPCDQEFTPGLGGRPRRPPECGR